MIMEVLSVIAIIVAGLMVGSELSIAALFTTLDRLPDASICRASALARVLADSCFGTLVFLLTLAKS